MDMKRKSKIFFIILGISVLILTPVIYLFYVKTDVNDFTKHDIKKGIHVAKSYFLAINEEDKETVKKILSKEFVERIGTEERLEQYIDSGMDVIFHNVTVSYEPEQQVGESDGLKYLYGKDTKIIYLSAEFDLAYREEKESVGAWINGHHYESMGVWLIKNDGKWKVLDWGY